MGSLKRCIGKVGLNEHEAGIIKAKVNAYRRRGFSAQESSIKAVGDYVAELEAERADVVAQLGPAAAQETQPPAPETSTPAAEAIAEATPPVPDAQEKPTAQPPAAEAQQAELFAPMVEAAKAMTEAAKALTETVKSTQEASNAKQDTKTGAPDEDVRQQQGPEERQGEMPAAEGRRGVREGGQGEEAVAAEPGDVIGSSPVDQAAHEAATSTKNELPQPTEAQKDAGNYRKGHITISGLDIAIENPEGSKRRPEWPTLKSHYGYLNGTVGKDKDHLDVFVKPGTTEDYSGPVFVVDQVNKDGTFDEHKIMLGFETSTAAAEGYLENYTPDWNGLGAMKQFTMPEFKLWLKAGNTKNPVALKGKKLLPKEKPEALADASQTEHVRRGREWWDGLNEEQRLAAAVTAGWSTEKGTPNFVAKRLAKTEWDDITPMSRETLMRKNGIGEQAAPAKTEERAEMPPASRIEDFGETIEGARKHYAEDYKNRMRDALGVDIASEPLSKSWPEPDYQKLLDGGADQWAVAFVHSARDEIPPKPRQSWKVTGWVENVKTLRGFSQSILDGSITKERVNEELNKKEFARLRDALNGRIDLYQAIGHEHSLKGIRISAAEYSILGGQKIDPPRVIWAVEKKAGATSFSNWPTMMAHGDTREEAIANFKKAVADGVLDKKSSDRDVSFDIYSYRSGSKAGKYYIGKKIGKNYVDLESFDDAKAARSYLAENKEKLVEKLEKVKYIPDERRASNAPRVGVDHRNGANVTPEQFSETFGFRGVQFGNYVEGAKRQADLNEAYDALMDMAGVLGIPPKALSLNGELGLAFGARGKGAAGVGRNAKPPKAHYEYDHVVINLTKEKGAGSLAHEWWHALDNYFSRMRGDKTEYLTEKAYPRGEGVRPEIVAAFKKVIQTINETGLKERSNRLDKTRTKPYWETGREMSARAFESYIVEKLRDQGTSNDYLANIVSEDYWRAAAALGMEKEGTYPYPEAAEIPAVRAVYDNFFRTVETKETDKGTALFSRAGDQTNTPEFKKWFGDSKVVDESGEPLMVYTGQPRQLDEGAIPATERNELPFGHAFFTNSREVAARYAGSHPDERGNKTDYSLGRNGRTYRVFLKIENPWNLDGWSEEDWRRELTDDDWKKLTRGMVWDDYREIMVHEFDGTTADDLERLSKIVYRERVSGQGYTLEYALAKAPDGRMALLFPKTAKRIAESRGYDGFIFEDEEIGGTTYVPFNPEQVKSATGNRGTFDPNDPNILLSRAGSKADHGISISDLETTVSLVTQGHKNLPQVIALERTEQAPDGLRQQIEEQGATDVEGAFYDGKVYLFAGNLRSEARAEHVLMEHELGHYGLRGVYGKELDPILNHIYLSNPKVARQAAELRKAHNLGSNAEAVEEVLVEMPSEELPRLRGWDRMVSFLRDWFASHGFNRLAERLNAGLVRKHGEQGAADLFAAEIVTKAREWARSGEQTAETKLYMGVTKLSEIKQADKVQTNTPEFKKWFGDSKVVDENMEPLVVYHGTTKDFAQFRSTSRNNEDGIFFSPDPQIASAYAGVDPQGNFHSENIGSVMPVFLALRNPLVVDFKGGKYGRADAIKNAKAGGHDGLIIRNHYDAGGVQDQYIAFHPEQIKSAIGNRGTFAAENPNILFSRPRPGDSQASEVAAEEEKDRLPQGIVSAYRDRAKNVIDHIDKALDPLGRLPESKEYLARRYRALGIIAKADEIAKGIGRTFDNTSEQDKQAIYDYFTTRDASPAGIRNELARNEAVKVKRMIESVGDAMVARGMLSEEAREAHRGSYLPQLYLKWLLDEADIRALGAGKKPSGMGYLKGRKIERTTGPDGRPQFVWKETGKPLTDAQVLDLGPISDPGFLSATAIATPVRDMALLDFLSMISQNEKWVLPNSIVNFDGQTVTPQWLKTEADRLRRQADHYDQDDATRTRALADRMDSAANKALGELAGDFKDYRQVPNTAKYGRLRGLWVRKEIYDDLVGVYDLNPTDPSFIQSLLGYGGIGTKVTQLWKMGKVALNPPSQVRNFVSNGVLLQLSGIPGHRIPGYLIRAAREISNDGKFWKVAKKYGVTESTFSTQELYRIKRDLLDLEMREGRLNWLGKLHRIGAIVADTASDAYQFSEAMHKTAKIMHAMDNGMSEAEAAIEAQKWLFDYSLVPKGVRYARNAPIGVPFITFYYKALPRLAEVALLHPQRLIPWVALFKGLPLLWASMTGEDDDEYERLQKAMPDWLRERGHALILPYKDENGRWQVIDLGYFMPWSMFTEFAGDLSRGEIGEAIKTAGLFSGPVTNVIVAIQTGKDPFTGRDIVDPGDPPGRQFAAVANYAYDMMMPPIIGSRGLLSPMGLVDVEYGGKIVQAATGRTNKYGDPTATAGQTAIYPIGFNVYGLEPDHSAAQNVLRYKYEADKTELALQRRLHNRGLSDDERQEIVNEYSEELQRRYEKIREYTEGVR